MFKKILVLVSVFSFLALSVNLVGAANLYSVSDTMSRQKIGTVSTHSIVMTLSAANTFDATETIVIDFKAIGAGSASWGTGVDATWTTADFALTDSVRSGVAPVAVGAAPSCSAGANNYTVTIDAASDRFTLTACSGFTAATAGTAETLAIAAGGTNRQITNPANATGSTAAYELWVTAAGDSVAEAEVPIFADDQVSVTATVDTYISFGVSTSNGGDNAINLGELRFSAVTTSNAARGAADGGSELSADNVALTLSTNAYYGTVIQVLSANGGLKSAASGNYTLTSASETLAADATTISGLAGYGLQAQTASVGGIGTLTKQTPYNGATTAVGLVETATWGTLYSTPTGGSTDAPLVDATAAVYVLAVPARNTPAADDYTDTLTFRATSTF